MNNYFGREEILDSVYAYDDGVVKGFMQKEGTALNRRVQESSRKGQRST